MYRDLTPAQQKLADYMSDLSEEAWSANWMEGLEYALWEVVLGVRDNWARFTFTAEHRAQLLHLSQACSGWITSDDITEETWLPIAEWESRFAEKQNTLNLPWRS